jgi:hypothetical protein
VLPIGASRAQVWDTLWRCTALAQGNVVVTVRRVLLDLGESTFVMRRPTLRTRRTLAVVAASVLAVVGCSLTAPTDDELLGLGSAVSGSGGGGTGGGSGGAAAGSGSGGTAGSGGSTVALCDNAQVDVGETGVDCGGTTCSKRCGSGEGCAVEMDCETQLVCTRETCAPPACTDGAQNGAETDTDCGGAEDCPRCSEGDSCIVGSDCTSGVCGDADTCAAPTCFDEVENGGESDTDCGGSCGACADGNTCRLDTDCDSQTCAPVANLPDPGCESSTTPNCLCDSCPAEATACAANTNCRNLIDCFLTRNCGSFEECAADNDCGNLIGAYGGMQSTEVEQARDLFSCAVSMQRCPTTCQTPPS